MTIGPQVRRAITADAKRLSILGREAFREAFAADHTAENLELVLRQSFSMEKQLQEIIATTSVFFILEEEEKAYGYARLLASDVPTCITGAHPVELSRFYLRSRWKGKGWGNILMYRCLEEALEIGYDMIWLKVWEHNQRAIDFFTRWGFQAVGTTISQFGESRQMDLIMQRPLG